MKDPTKRQVAQNEPGSDGTQSEEDSEKSSDTGQVLCDEGHTMQLTKRRIYGPNVNVECNRCEKVIQTRNGSRKWTNDMKKGFYHCSECKWDLCLECTQGDENESEKQS